MKMAGIPPPVASDTLCPGKLGGCQVIQCLAVRTHRLLMRAPPQTRFLNSPGDVFDGNVVWKKKERENHILATKTPTKRYLPF
jgi:hypothetical protein